MENKEIKYPIIFPIRNDSNYYYEGELYFEVQSPYECSLVWSPYSSGEIRISLCDTYYDDYSANELTLFSNSALEAFEFMKKAQKR